MSYLADNIALTCDPLGCGRGSPQHLELGFRATRGLVFPSYGDVILLARRRLYPEPEGWRYCGGTHATETTIMNGAGFTHEADMGYHYTVAFCRANGFRSAFSEPTRIDFDGDGDLIEPRLPIWPRHIGAIGIAGGMFSVRWTYEPYGQGDFPADFQVFGGPDADNVDYETPLTHSQTGLSYVPYIHRQRHYEFTSGAYDDLDRQVFGIRWRNSGGIAEKNVYTTQTARAHSSAPPPAGIHRIWQGRQ